MSKIPAKILNDDCTIVYDSICRSNNRHCTEVTLNDIQPAPKQHSFLHITTVLSDEIYSESKSISDKPDPNSGESNQNQT